MNDFTNRVHADAKAVEGWAEGVADKFLAALDREWSAVKPDALKLGMTVASEIMVAAQTVATGGATSSEALATIVAQLPAELKELEHIAITLFGLAVTDCVTSSTPATTSTP